MEKNFYLVRHGETDFNAQDKWQGCQIDALLNEEGQEQANALAEKVSSFKLTSIYSSPLLRAVQTANILVHKMSSKLPICIMQDLRECNFGECEGLTFKDVEAKYGKSFIDTLCWPTFLTWKERFFGGESKKEVFLRVIECLSYIARMTSETDNRIGVVCHAGVFSALQCGLGLKDVCYDNCSVLHLVYDTDGQKWKQAVD